MRSTKNIYKFALLLLAIGLLAGCAAPTPTATPQPSDTPVPTATPTVTPLPFYVSAEVWSGELQVPILIYHRFGNEDHDLTPMWVTQSVFKEQLQKLYDAGYSLVSLTSWLDGTFSVPYGRKPLILTIDDGWYADQIYINDDGTPADYSGIGMLWQFVQEHPDFQFAASINVIMGDKSYGDIRYGDWNYVSDGDAWKTKLAGTIAWALDNNVEAFNHTYQHIDLSQALPATIREQLSKNDEEMRKYLALAGRSDLVDKLQNVIAAPQGLMPTNSYSLAALYDYTDPEGKPVKAILAAYNSTDGVLAPSVFSANFNKYSIPRTTATNYSIDWVISQKDSVPTAAECKLGPTEESLAGDAGTLQALISSAVHGGACPEGVYQVSGFVFVAKDGAVTQYQ